MDCNPSAAQQGTLKNKRQGLNADSKLIEFKRRLTIAVENSDFTIIKNTV